MKLSHIGSVRCLNRNRHFLLKAALLAPCILAVTSVHALLVYDGFAYADGTVVPDSGNSMNGGTGSGALLQWTGGWNDVSPDSGANAYVVNSPGLTYDSLTVGGNALNHGTDNLGAQRNFTAASSGTYYVSFLLNITDAASTYAGVTFGGAYFGSINANGVRQLGVAGSYGSGTSALTDTVLSSTATTFLLVGKIDYSSSGADTVSLWVNPLTSVEAGAGAAAAVNTGLNLTSLGAVYIYQSATAFNITVDEVRFGTSWGEVTPGLAAIPEPGVLTLLGSAGLLLLVLRRRHRLKNG